jgi:WD40 repeat protein
MDKSHFPSTPLFRVPLNSANSKVKLWDAHHERELLRTFSGHGKSVTTFLSTSFNRQMKLWDQQETSKVATGGLDGVIRYWGIELFAGWEIGKTAVCFKNADHTDWLRRFS